jgi:hypothetical protein
MIERIHASFVAPATSSTSAYAITVSKVTDAPDPNRPFATHTEVYPAEVGRPAYLIWGHYDLTLEEASADFLSRLKADTSLACANNIDWPYRRF